jgi:signal peptidase II
VSRARSTLRALAVLLAVIALDQAAKALVRSALERGDSESILPGVDLVNVRNEGVAFGLFDDGGVLLIAIGVGALLALLAFFVLHADRPLVWLPTGLLIGGAVGNLIDRIRDGAVTDFVKLPGWPAFNVADMAITVGVLALLYVLEGPPRRREHEARERTAVP